MYNTYCQLVTNKNLTKNKTKQGRAATMAVKTKLGLAFELVPTANEQILELDKVLSS